MHTFESSEAFRALAPSVQTWFRGRYPSLTPIQERVISRVAQREHVLGLSATGTGKTWAAFLGVLSELALAREAGPVDGIFALYLSPLKALSANVRVALDGPIEAINAALKLSPKSELQVATRTGDTSPSARAKQQRRPPHVLLTTPESLSTLLAQKKWHEPLSRVRYVIVDEIHALAESKRGALLSVNLEHLERVVGRPFVRIGLSATAEPADLLADFLGGAGRRVHVERGIESREHRVELHLPRLELRGPPAARPVEEPGRRERFISNKGIPQGALSSERRAQIARRLKVKFPEVERSSSDVDVMTVDPPIVVPEPVPPRPLRPLPVAGYPSALAGPEILRLIEGCRTALVFTNTRSAAERLTLRLRELMPGEKIEAHHGSLDAATRTRVETHLAAGELRVCVCSSSLELGIDIGAVDRVILVSAPKGVARTLQRLGRSRHHVGGISEGALVPISQLDLAECVATRTGCLSRRLESVRLPRSPLDVLAQTILGAVAAVPVHDNELFETITRAHSFRTLSRAEFDAAVEYLLGAGAVLGHYSEFSKLVRNETGALEPRNPKVVRTYLQNLGTITSDLTISVYLRTGKRLGEVEESFVTSLPKGAVFSVGGRPVELLNVEGLKAYVRPVRRAAVIVPRWRGSRMPLSASVANELLAQRHLAREVLATDSAETLAARFESRFVLERDVATSLSSLYALQAKASRIPADDAVLVEEVQEQRARMLFLHVVAGRAANAAIALVAAYRASLSGIAVATAVDDTGILLSLPARSELRGSASVARWLRPHSFMDDLERALEQTDAVTRLFRGVAQVGQLLVRRVDGAEKGARSSQWSASVLFRTLKQYDPNHILLQEARREFLEDELEVDRALNTLRRMEGLPIEYVELPRPSPLVLGLYASASRDTIGTDDPDRLLEELIDDLESRWKRELS